MLKLTFQTNYLFLAKIFVLFIRYPIFLFIYWHFTFDPLSQTLIWKQYSYFSYFIKPSLIWKRQRWFISSTYPCQQIIIQKMYFKKYVSIQLLSRLDCAIYYYITTICFILFIYIVVCLVWLVFQLVSINVSHSSSQLSDSFSGWGLRSYYFSSQIIANISWIWHMLHKCQLMTKNVFMWSKYAQYIFKALLR